VHEPWAAPGCPVSPGLGRGAPDRGKQRCGARDGRRTQRGDCDAYRLRKADERRRDCLHLRQIGSARHVDRDPGLPGVGACCPADLQSDGAILAFVHACPYVAVLEPELNLRHAKILNIALLSCVAALGLGRPAEAAYVVVNADPAFGPALPKLGWRATGALFVPDACAIGAAVASGAVGSPYKVTLSSVPWYFFGTCAGAMLQDVKLYFYNTDDPGTNIELLKFDEFGANSDPGGTERELVDFTFNTVLSPVNTSVVAFHTTLSDPEPASDWLAGNGRYSFALEFSSDNARLVAYGPNGEVIESPNRARVTISPLRGLLPGEPEYVVTADEPVSPTQVVPEPGTWSLILMALALSFGLGRVGPLSARRK
jgi:hypothetical protein